ncbi:DegT/DnrJ/EryC1/StrS family aminotransferase [Candidatus Woesearchaeota archaeon]|nr:MAG: DegT/DnrJ/EryC1/StrS family aminotransferase [Candidatus Woesearchaeota archaeon]
MIPPAKPIMEKEEKEAVLKVLESGMIAAGPKVKELEEKFAQLCGTKHAVAVSSGTSALHTAMYAAGIKQGDEVITTPFTFVATANSIVMQNARPVFADIREDFFTIDANDVLERITPKTKAILPVDLYGQPYDVKAIREIAEDHNLKIIEDAAQSVNASFEGKKTGALGDIAAFSLYATKNITSGEGGVLTTDNDEYAELARRFRHHGQSEKTRYEYYDIGYNYRMTDIQAAIAIEQIRKVDEFTRARQKNAAMLDRKIDQIKGLKKPATMKGATHVYHQYTIRVTEEFPKTRDELLSFMRERGIGCAVYYPKPLHLHPFFLKMGYKEGDFPVSERASREVLSIPVHPAVTEEDMEIILKALEESQNE